jgi:hypothetical protein
MDNLKKSRGEMSYSSSLRMKNLQAAGGSKGEPPPVINLKIK